MDEPFVGEICCVAFGYPPVGWMPCDGRLLPIVQYQPLYALIGTRYGGDGTTNFALPDLRGRVLAGMGTGTGLSPVTLGEKIGVESVALATTELPAHTHNVFAAADGGRGAAQDPTGRVYAPNTAATIWAKPPAQPAAMNAAMVGQSGGSQPHENRMPYTAVNYYIAYNGIFPSRP